MTNCRFAHENGSFRMALKESFHVFS